MAPKTYYEHCSIVLIPHKHTCLLHYSTLFFVNVNDLFTSRESIGVEMSIAHSISSTAEGIGAQVLVFMPPYMSYQPSSLVTLPSHLAPNSSPVVENPPEHYLKFKVIMH